MKKNLVLTGMMGVGKSTVGKILAKKLKLKFVDIDRKIEKKEKTKIKDIFDNKGEGYFRTIEKIVTLQELKKKDLLISLGGGAFVNKLIRKEVKKSSISFWLDLDINTLLARLKNTSKRPLLDHDNLEQTINKIYSERKKIYNESTYRIKCNSMSLDEITNQILKLYENAGN